MSKKLLRSIFAVFLALFMFGTSVNPAVYATGQEEETAEQKDPNETAVQEAPAESLTLGQTPDGSTDADEAAEKEVIRSFVLNDIPESVQSAEDLPETLSAELEGEEADNVKVDVEWNEVTENDAVCFVPSLTEESEKSYTLSADAEEALNAVEVKKQASESNTTADAAKENDGQSNSSATPDETVTDNKSDEQIVSEGTDGNETGAPATDNNPSEKKEEAKVSNSGLSYKKEERPDKDSSAELLLGAPAILGAPASNDAASEDVVAVIINGTTETPFTKFEGSGDEEYALKHWTAGTTLKLMTDVFVTKSIETPEGAVTLDLNGHKLSTGKTGMNQRVLVHNGSTLTLNDTGSGGLITREGTQGGRGVTVESGGTFIMNSGSISGNSMFYGQEDDVGGGVKVLGSFTMNGGTISNNVVGGNGAGVYVANGGTFTLEDGTITANKPAIEGYSINGGGICVDNNGTVKIKGGTISGNIVNGGDGAGIYVFKSTLDVSGGTISDNTSTGRGGGICVSSDSVLNLSGGTINKNSAEYGGGIYDDVAKAISISGGSIINNTATSNGGGVMPLSIISISRNPVISGNKKGSADNDLYLRDSIMIDITALTEGANIGVFRNKPGDFTRDLKATGSSPDNFFSNDPNYVVLWNTDETEATLTKKAPHNITVSESTHGTVTTDKTDNIALAGETVTLTVNPESNYELDTLTVTTKSGKTVEVDQKTNSFVMPDEDVTVSATFKHEPVTVTLDVEMPEVGYEIEGPDVTAVPEEYNKNLLYPVCWFPTGDDAVKYLYDQTSDYEMCKGYYQAGETYYGAAAIKPDEEEFGSVSVSLSDSEYVKQYGKVISLDGKKWLVFSVTIPAITVTVEFGSEHAGIAAKAADLYEKDEELYRKVELTVTGSKLVFKAKKGADLGNEIKSIIHDIMSTIHPTFPNPDPVIDENGDRLLFSPDSINLKPMSGYADYEAWWADYDKAEDHGEQLEDITMYVQWEKATGLAIKITPPLCGTEVIIDEEKRTQEPAPEVTIISGKVEKYEDYPPRWLKNETLEPFSGKMKGGEKYSVVLFGHIAPVFGYYINEDEFTVEGGTLSERSYVTQGMILINDVTAEHVPGEWEVKEEPSVGKEGTEVRKCSGCGEELESRPIPAITYSVKAGDGQTWTKGSGVTADFEFTRSYEDTAFERFTEVVIDGKKVTDFTKEKGSVITKISAAYMETLPVGGHTITAKFNDGGSASATFTVKDKAPEPKPAPSNGGSSKKPTKPADNVVTCQMAGYPANYSWNEAAKACQPGYIDAGGNFHPYRTVVRKVPNTADRDIMIHAWIAMLSITIGLFCGVKLLHEDWEV